MAPELFRVTAHQRAHPKARRFFYKYDSIAFVILPGRAGGLAFELDLVSSWSGKKFRRLPHHASNRQVSRARALRLVEIQPVQKRSCWGRQHFEGGTCQH